jgi:hypothetical protein
MSLIASRTCRFPPRRSAARSVDFHGWCETRGVLLARGYIAREVDPSDARRKRLQVTDHGFNMLRESEVIFDKLRAQWATQIGADRLKDMEAHLAELTGPRVTALRHARMVSRDLGGAA